MQDKNKVTLYLPPELHRQLKIRAAVEAEPMSTIAERAIVFYLTHPGVVDEVEMSHGQVHQVHTCPGCDSPLVLRDGEMIALKEQPSVLADDKLPLTKVGATGTDSQGGQELVLAN